MTCIIKLLNNTPKSICNLGLKKSGIIIKKNIAFRTGHVKLFRTGHFSIGCKNVYIYVHPKYHLNWI